MRTVEKWRYHCPRGHTGWEMTAQTFWCAECYRRVPGETGQFEQVRDQKTDERIDAAELRNRLSRA